MSDIIRNNDPGRVQNNPTSKKQREDYKTFYLKKSTWEAIKISRGWVGRGSISRFAETIGVTRSYASDLVSQNVGCSSNVMRRVKELLGLSNGSCWCHLFDEHSQPADPNHPIFNMMKFNGEIPYTADSDLDDLRKHEYRTESH